MCRPGDVVPVWRVHDDARVHGGPVKCSLGEDCPICSPVKEESFLETPITMRRVWAYGAYTPGDTPGWYARYEPVSREDQVRV